jgi:hypothetical protein
MNLLNFPAKIQQIIQLWRTNPKKISKTFADSKIIPNFAAKCYVQLF